MKFKTFICDLCKTSHQAISHRVKSISMSTWTIEEVKELSGEMNGGNDAARHNWLQNAPAIGERYSGGMRPKQGDKVEVYKQFILDCYEYGRFKASSPYVHDGAASFQQEKVTAAAPVAKPIQNSSPRKVTQVAPQEIDLLGFDSAIDTSSCKPAAAFDPFQSNGNNDVFGNFQSSQVAPSTSVASNTFDPFGVAQPTLSLAQPSPMNSSMSANNTPVVAMNAPALVRTQTYPPSNSVMAPGMNISMMGAAMAPPNNMGMGGMGMAPNGMNGMGGMGMNSMGMAPNSMGMGGMGMNSMGMAPNSMGISNMGMAPNSMGISNMGMTPNSMGMGGMGPPTNMGMNSMGMAPNNMGMSNMGMAPPPSMNGMGMGMPMTNQSPLMMSSNSMMQRTNNNMGTSSMAISGLSATSMTHTNTANNNVFASLYQSAPKY